MSKKWRGVTIIDDLCFIKLKVRIPSDLMDSFIDKFNRLYANSKIKHWARGFCKKKRGHLLLCAPVMGRDEDKIYPFIEKFCKENDVPICDQTYIL